MRKSQTMPFALAFVFTTLAALLAACGGEAEPTVGALTPTNTPIPAPAATLPPTPSPTATPEPTATPTPAPMATAIPTATPEPTSTPEPTQTPVPLTVYDEFGFTLKLDRGAGVNSAGFTEPEPSNEQGLITLEFGGVNNILSWNPAGNSTTLSLVNNIYQILQDQRPDSTFNTLSEGDLTVSGQPGFFAGYRTTDPVGEVAGGLIGAWICPSADTAYTLARGPDATLVQLRFDRLLDNFSCP